jgi:predicted MFS family arabinose efflux permease
MLVSGLATDFTTLLLARVVAGIAGGGIFPVGIAVIGDLVPVRERQGRDRALAHRGGSPAT